ncbi:MAG TPA: phosphate acetyltransferase [Caldithrix sp.]|nr:phosphate acetyltransferase [Caldithrix sp.]
MNIIEKIREQAKQHLKPIVLPEGGEARVVRAAGILLKEKIATPILLGKVRQITDLSTDIKVDLTGAQILDPVQQPEFDAYAQEYYRLREHKGMTPEKAREVMKDPLYFGAMLVRKGRAAGAVAGSVNTTGNVLRAAIQIVGLAEGINVVSSSFIMVLPKGEILTFADCAVIPDPDAEQLASIAVSSANTHRKLVGSEPRVAMLSFSTKGSAQHELVEKVVRATEMVNQSAPDLIVDGELQFDAAYVEAVGKKKAPGSPVAGKANVFIFPDLNSGNIGYKMVQRLAGAEAVGPVIQGLAKPYNDLSRGCSVDDIVNVAAICSILS